MKTIIYSPGQTGNLTPGYWNGTDYSTKEPERAMEFSIEEAQAFCQGKWEANPRKVNLFEVGDPCTYRIHTDCRAHVVIEVRKKGREIVIQECNAKLLNGVNSGEPDALHFSPGGFCGHTSGTQRWEITPNPTGNKLTISFRAKVARWKINGHGLHSPGCEVTGGWHHYYDFNF